MKPNTSSSISAHEDTTYDILAGSKNSSELMKHFFFQALLHRLTLIISAIKSETVELTSHLMTVSITVCFSPRRWTFCCRTHGGSTSPAAARCQWAGPSTRRWWSRPTSRSKTCSGRWRYGALYRSLQSITFSRCPKYLDIWKISVYFIKFKRDLLKKMWPYFSICMVYN